MIELRPIGEAELGAYETLVARAFMGVTPPPEDIEAARSLVELDRTLAAFEAGEMVATAGIISLPLTVPDGRRLAAAGVTRVTGAPGHRRRGLLREIMRRQLDGVRERGEAVAILFASEAGIYGRFGYGLASYEARVEVRRARSAFLRPVPLDGVRYVDAEGALDALPGIARRAALRHPGMVVRSDAWWRYHLREAPARRGGGGERFHVLHLGAGGPDGYATYRKTVEWDQAGAAAGVVHLESLMAESDLAYAALWRHCLDIDLTASLSAQRRPVDEPLRHLLADPRALEARLLDGLWLRVVDVAAALEARTYEVEGRLAFGVEDEFCPWNRGAYLLEGGRCRRAAVEPELVLPAAALGALYLGGNRVTAMVRAGAAEERAPGAAARADAMFASPVAPWCAFMF